MMSARWSSPATSQRVGSARELDRLCENHNAYRWLCGGVSVNYHGLSDFRVANPELIKRLLCENVAALSVTRRGPATGPSLAELDAFLA